MMLRIALIVALLPACERRLEPGDDTGSDGVDVERPPVQTNASDQEPEDSGADTGADDTGVPFEPGEACYLGATGDGSLCLPLVAPEDLPADYDYPEPLGGSPDYRAPVAYLDLEALDPATQLAPNFQLDEFAEAAKGRYAVVQPHAVASIQGLRDELGPLVVNSGYRSPGYNSGVDGSATYSRHMYGDAADLDPINVSLATLEQACTDAGAGYVGVYTTHIHCDWRDDHVDTVFFGPASARARPTPAPWPFHDASIARDGQRLRAPAEGWDEGEPLREWYARDARGALLETVIAETYVPPADASEVTVVVGRVVTRTIQLGEL